MQTCIMLYNGFMKSNTLFYQCRRILAGLCILGEAFMLADVVDDLLFELEYLGEWGYDYLLKDIFMLASGLVIIWFLVSAIIDSGKQISMQKELQLQEEQAHFDSIRSRSRSAVQESVSEEEELSPDELQEMLQKDFGEQKRNARG